MLGATTAADEAVTNRPEHRCVVYTEDGAFLEQALRYLADGSKAGARLQLIGSGTPEQLESRLRAVEGFAELLDGEELAVRSLSDQYGPDEIIDPHATVAAYARATEDALAAGHTALRVVADATALVRTAAQRAAFASYEHLVDRYMVDHAFEALCGYDARALGPASAAELACLHPIANPGAAPFRLHADVDGGLRLLGEVDLVGEDLFDAALARTVLAEDEPRRIDARALGFIDHHGLLALERHARTAGTRVELLTDTAVVHRLVQLLGLRAVRPRWSG